jgi:hypothetical protein
MVVNISREYHLSNNFIQNVDLIQILVIPVAQTFLSNATRIWESENPLTLEWVRERRWRHSLPVVAIGSVPYISRCASFTLRATPAKSP